MTKRLLALPALLLIAAAVPKTVPVYDIYEAADGGIVADVGKPFIIRTADDRAPKHQWTASGPDLVLVQRAAYHTEPTPEGGVGFSDGEELMLKIMRPGVHQVTVQFVNTETGVRYFYYSPKVISVTVR